MGYYFSGKDEILQVAFEHVLDETNVRIRAAVQGLSGVIALRSMCREIMPLADETRLEARIAIALWQRALNDPVLAAVNNKALDGWSRQMAAYWQEAIDDGEVPPVDVSAHVTILLTWMVGLQVTVALGRGHTGSAEQLSLLDQLIGFTGR